MYNGIEFGDGFFNSICANHCQILHYIENWSNVFKDTLKTVQQHSHFEPNISEKPFNIDNIKVL